MDDYRRQRRQTTLGYGVDSMVEFEGGSVSFFLFFFFFICWPSEVCQDFISSFVSQMYPLISYASRYHFLSRTVSSLPVLFVCFSSLPFSLSPFPFYIYIYPNINIPHINFFLPSLILFSNSYDTLSIPLYTKQKVLHGPNSTSFSFSFFFLLLPPLFF